MDKASYVQFLGNQHFSPEHAEYLYDDMLDRVDGLHGNVIADYPVYDDIRRRHVCAAIRNTLRNQSEVLRSAPEAMMHLPLWKKHCSTRLARHFVKSIIEIGQNHNDFSRLEMTQLCAGYVGNISELGGRDLQQSATALLKNYRTAMQYILAYHDIDSLPAWARNTVQKPQETVESDRIAPSRWSGKLSSKTCESAGRRWEYMFTQDSRHEGECILLSLPEHPDVPVAALKLYKENSVLALETVRSPSTGFYPLVEGGLYGLDVTSVDDVLSPQDRVMKFPVAVMNSLRFSPQRMLGEHPRWERTIDMQMIKTIARQKASEFMKLLKP